MAERIITAAEARALREAATPGPWRITCADSVAPRVGGAWPVAYVPGDDDDRPWDVDGDAPVEPTPLADADLIAAAPDLARTVEQLTAERDALQRRIAESEAVRAVAIQAGEQVTAERDRLARILAVERGDQTQAPAGWLGDHGVWWRNRERGSPLRVMRRPKTNDQPVTDWGPPGEDWTRPTALEAMEAIDAGVSDGET